MSCDFKAAVVGSESLINNPLKSEENDFINAKAYLLQTSPVTGHNLYDHLAGLLTRVLSERPSNPVDIIEDISKDVKQTKFIFRADTILDKVDRKAEVALAEIQLKLFLKKDGTDEDATLDEGADTALPNIMEQCFYFEQAGIGLCREEMFRIWLAIKSLMDSHPLEHARFWGKIFGLEQNYIVAEVEYKEGEEEVDADEEELVESEEGKDEAANKENEDNDEGEEEAEIEPPKSTFKPPPAVPKEDPRTGCNRKTYFVCCEPGKPWVKLPNVTPAQIFVARKIKKFLTGRLEAPIVSYPPFPGDESNYLRAQIARISAGTHISPIGYYQFDPDAEEPEEGAVRANFVVNAEFEPLPTRDLIDSSLANWVHHVLHILPQGRCQWWNPVAKKEDEEAGEGEEEEEEEAQVVVEPEVGPPLLSPLSEDEEIAGVRPWTPRISSKLVPSYAVAVIDSNLWPGAHAFAIGKTFENIYIGWGHKYSPDNYTPAPPAAVYDEYPNGPEITETEDPTAEQEAALKAANEVGEEDENEDEGEEEEGEAGTDED